MFQIAVTLYMLSVATGLEIDVDTKAVDTCITGNRMMKIICMTSASEFDNNTLSITKGPSASMMKLTECQRNGMKCTPPMLKRYRAMFDGDDVVLMVLNVDYKNDSTTWSCKIGSQKATIKVKFTGHDPCEIQQSCFGLTNSQVIISASGAGVLILLLLSIIVCCVVCRRRKDVKEDMTQMATQSYRSYTKYQTPSSDYTTTPLVENGDKS